MAAVAVQPHTPTLITADDIAAALGITPDTTDYSLSDSYGLTYSGPAAHLVLAALMRPDLTPDLPRAAADDLRSGETIREAAALLEYWFTVAATPTDHAARLAGLSAYDTCRIIANTVHCDRNVWRYVGPDSLPYYTDYLTKPDEFGTSVWPAYADEPYQPLGNPIRALDITATHPSGQTTVAVRVAGESTASLHWDIDTVVHVPIADLHDLLTGDAHDQTTYLTEQESIGDELAWEHSQTVEGDTSLEIIGPAKADDTPTRVQRAPVFYVGTDPEHAARTAHPYFDRAAADRAAKATPGHEVFTAEVPLYPVPAANLRLAD